MKIGDKVSFLSDSGGGIVVGFQGKNIVLVEDEYGFQIPTLISEVVVVGSSDDYDISNVVSHRINQPVIEAEKHNEEAADRPITFRPKPMERKEGNRLNCYIAFVPSDAKNLSKTHFEMYFVNDSNYIIYYALLRQENAAHILHHTEEVEPNMLSFIEDIGYADLNGLERLCVQMVAYKRDKAFVMKPAINVNVRLDLTKFYKLHCFTENDFFESPALLFPLIVDDRPVDHRPMEQAVCALQHDGVGADVKSGHSNASMDTENDSYVRRYEQKSGKQRHPFLPKKRNDDIVIDLHASALLDSTVGLKPKEILDYQLNRFRQVMQQYLKQKGTRIVFIHGKGEGVLRQALINELKHSFKSCQYQDASFLEYGYGATLVTIR